MVKLKKINVHKAICPTCNGNGFIKIKDREDPTVTSIHQCWDCESEGEFYVHEPEAIQPDNPADSDADDDVKLH